MEGLRCLLDRDCSNRHPSRYLNGHGPDRPPFPRTSITFRVVKSFPMVLPSRLEPCIAVHTTPFPFLDSQTKNPVYNKIRHRRRRAAIPDRVTSDRSYDDSRHDMSAGTEDSPLVRSTGKHHPPSARRSLRHHDSPGTAGWTTT